MSVPCVPSVLFERVKVSIRCVSIPACQGDSVPPLRTELLQNAPLYPLSRHLHAPLSPPTPHLLLSPIPFSRDNCDLSRGVVAGARLK